MKKTKLFFGTIVLLVMLLAFSVACFLLLLCFFSYFTGFSSLSVTFLSARGTYGKTFPLYPACLLSDAKTSEYSPLQGTTEKTSVLCPAFFNKRGTTTNKSFPLPANTSKCL